VAAAAAAAAEEEMHDSGMKDVTDSAEQEVKQSPVVNE
jgi:hypothetical protein